MLTKEMVPAELQLPGTRTTATKEATVDTISVAEHKAVRDRVERGMDLYRSGAVGVHGDAYVVRGAARSYTVFFGDGEPRCDCPDYRERCRDAGHACKHGYAAVAFEARERCRPTARPKTGHRH